MRFLQNIWQCWDPLHPPVTFSACNCVYVPTCSFINIGDKLKKRRERREEEGREAGREGGEEEGRDAGRSTVWFIGTSKVAINRQAEAVAHTLLLT